MLCDFANLTRRFNEDQIDQNMVLQCYLLFDQNIITDVHKNDIIMDYGLCLLALCFAFNALYRVVQKIPRQMFKFIFQIKGQFVKRFFLFCLPFFLYPVSLFFNFSK